MIESQYILEDKDIEEIVLTMNRRVFNLEDLNPAKYNPRTIDDESLNGLGESLSDFGYIQPIIVNIRDNLNIIVGGHQRYKILKKKGILKAECVIVDVDQIKEKAMNISLNNPEISGRWDLNKLELLTAELKDEIENFDQLRLDSLELSLDLNNIEFNDYDEEDEDRDKEFSPEQLYVIEIEFLPEDYELFLEIVNNEDISFKSPSKKVQYGLKLSQYLKRVSQPVDHETEY